MIKQPKNNLLSAQNHHNANSFVLCKYASMNLDDGAIRYDLGSYVNSNTVNNSNANESLDWYSAIDTLLSDVVRCIIGVVDLNVISTKDLKDPAKLIGNLLCIASIAFAIVSFWLAQKNDKELDTECNELAKKSNKNIEEIKYKVMTTGQIRLQEYFKANDIDIKTDDIVRLADKSEIVKKSKFYMLISKNRKICSQKNTTSNNIYIIL